jgi:hypothetical protein
VMLLIMFVDLTKLTNLPEWKSSMCGEPTPIVYNRPEKGYSVYKCRRDEAKLTLPALSWVKRKQVRKCTHSVAILSRSLCYFL